MRDELIEQLYCNHPHVFKKSETATGNSIVKYELPDSWFTLVDCMLECIERDVDHAQKSLSSAIHYAEPKRIVLDEARFAETLDELPFIIQITKMGGRLSVFTTGCNNINQAYINSATMMSYRTCEVCGLPGSRMLSWCFCETCMKTVKQGAWGDYIVPR